MEYSQAELVEGIKNKDSAAYEYMIKKYSCMVYKKRYDAL